MDNAQVDISEQFGRPRETPICLGQGELSAFILTAGCRFDAELGQPLMSALPSAIPILGVQKSTPEWLRIGIEFLLQETRERRPGHQSILNRLGDIWFVEVLRTYIESLPEGNDSWLRALKDPALALVLSAIHKHPGRPWTVPALAQMACLSRSAFADRFQKIMGKPPLTYVSEHRMRVAAWQLRHTGQPICHIGDAVGYASETAFGQAFKRSYGLAPSRYREQMRQLAASNGD
jgi:AraC-like DNA-binding protein